MRISPIDASAGKHTRHQLNRGGDRHANNALWRIAMVATCNSAPTSRVDQWKGNRRRRSSDASNITLPVRSTCCSSIRRQLRAPTVVGSSGPTGACPRSASTIISTSL
ncbi:transposase [Rhodococcus qingshengii]|nr:transposase [Rhodococcus qingshengii]